LIAVFFVPVQYYVIETIAEWRKRRRAARDRQPEFAD
jgi:hypothetical protein